MEQLFIKIEDGRIVGHPMLQSNVYQIAGVTGDADTVPDGFARFVDVGAPEYNPLKTVTSTYVLDEGVVYKRYKELNREFSSPEEAEFAQVEYTRLMEDKEKQIAVTRF